MSIPAWVNDAIFYQIFPDRFFNGNLENDPPNVHPWGSKPDGIHFQGGDLEGIIQKLDYLIDLGINAIYLNPIFLSPSNHRYNTVDYFRIDPKLGSNEEFKRFLHTLHRRNFHLILDGVFNHCGRGFFAFNDVLENGPNSPYREWFHINKFPLQANTSGEARHYQGWWGHKSLPKFNTDYPQVRNYLLNIASYWIEQGIDGWRLDVPIEIDDDEFWAEFRGNVKKVNPDAYLVGEIWDVNPRWVGESHFDGLMHYPLRNAVIGLINGSIQVKEFSDSVLSFQTAYPVENLTAMYLLLGSHDTERIFTMLGEDSEKVRLAFSLLFAFPGVTSIYYGDEIGLGGGKDPGCRKPFLWNENHWDYDLWNYIKQLVKIRKASPTLRVGDFKIISSTHEQRLLTIIRSTTQETILCVFNPSESYLEEFIPIDDPEGKFNREVVDLLSQRVKAYYAVGGYHLSMPAWRAAFFKIN